MNPNDNETLRSVEGGDRVRTESSPLITIATVTFNAEGTLEPTLQSVAAQDYPRIEHLIIDGCSSDHTLGLIQRYVEQNTTRHNIRLVREPDDGLYDAMNKAILQAAGDYIVFLNAGDRLHSTDTISQVAKAADWVKGDSSNPAVIYGETDLVDAQGRFLRHRRLCAPEHLSWRSFLSGMLVCHQSFYARTDIARSELYNLQYRFSADYDWCIRIMKRAHRKRIQMVNTHQILTDYLSEGLTTKNHHRSLLERFRLMAHHYGWTLTILQHLWFFIRAVVKR